MKSCSKLPLHLIEPMPAGFKVGLTLSKTESIRNSSDASKKIQSGRGRKKSKIARQVQSKKGAQISMG